MKERDINLPAIAIVSNAITGGGAEKSMLALHESFLKYGLKSNLIALNTSVNQKKIPHVIELNRKWKSGVINTWSNYLDFKKLVKNVDPDVLILNCELPEFYGALLRFNGNLICVEHTSKPWTGKPLLGIIVRLALKFKRADWVTVILNEHKVWVGGFVVAHLPNPYSDHQLKNRVIDQSLMLTFVGSFKPNKHPEWVIETGLELNLSVQLFGDGLLNRQLKDRYNNHTSQIRFLGFKSDPWNSISSKSLVIVPSDYEGDGLVVVEAIMSGNPLLLRDNKDLRRFGLEDKHYFRDLENLKLVVKQNLDTRFQNLVVSDSEADKLRLTRSLQKVTNDWIDLILARSHTTQPK